MRVSEYEITKLAKGLDQVVELSLRPKLSILRQVSPIASRTRISESSIIWDTRISACFHKSQRRQDLKDAIASGRDLVAVAPEGTHFYTMDLSNPTD